MKSQLIIGVSTRAMAESALKAGERPMTVDYFGDRDQKTKLSNLSVMRDFNLPLKAASLYQIALSQDFQNLIYVAGLDNHPDMLAALAAGKARIWGSGPEALARAKDWAFLRRLGAELDIPMPVTLLPGEEDRYDSTSWLVKPERGGGGRGVRHWRGAKLHKGEIAQEMVLGVAASAALVSDGARVRLLGLSEQLMGLRAFGTSGFRWCGNLYPLACSQGVFDELWERVSTMAEKLAPALCLQGVFGVDLMLKADEKGGLLPVVVEINPRSTASMELMEMSLGRSVYSLHVDACQGKLPAGELPKPDHYRGKAVVFAARRAVAPDTGTWEMKNRKDIPFAGDVINEGSPICTVFASGLTREKCLARLAAEAETLRREMEDELRS